MSVDDGELGEVGGVVIGYTEDQEGAIVGGDGAGAAVVVGGCEDSGSDLFGRLVWRYAGEDGRKAVSAEFFQLRVERFKNAVGGEQYGVAWDEVDRDLVVLRVGKQPEGYSGDAQGLDDAVANEERIGAAGVGKRKFAGAGIVDRKKRGDEAAVEMSLVQAGVEHGEHFVRRTGMLDDVYANDADG